MKICCDTGKEIKTDTDRLGCGHDRCTGAKEETVQQKALRELVEMSQEMGLYDEGCLNEHN